jgi:predicted RNase H-like nuclease (RuvC/YqgF family)
MLYADTAASMPQTIFMLSFHGRMQVQELTKECAALREQVAELRGKLSGADNVRAEATEATRTIVRREQEIDRLKEDLGDANAQISMLRAELAEAEASHRMVSCQNLECFRISSPKRDLHLRY